MVPPEQHSPSPCHPAAPLGAEQGEIPNRLGFGHCCDVSFMLPKHRCACSQAAEQTFAHQMLNLRTALLFYPHSRWHETE